MLFSLVGTFLWFFVKDDVETVKFDRELMLRSIPDYEKREVVPLITLLLFCDQSTAPSNVLRDSNIRRIYRREQSLYLREKASVRLLQQTCKSPASELSATEYRRGYVVASHRLLHEEVRISRYLPFLIRSFGSKFGKSFKNSLGEFKEKVQSDWSPAIATATRNFASQFEPSHEVSRGRQPPPRNSSPPYRDSSPSMSPYRDESPDPSLPTSVTPTAPHPVSVLTPSFSNSSLSEVPLPPAPEPPTAFPAPPPPAARSRSRRNPFSEPPLVTVDYSLKQNHHPAPVLPEDDIDPFEQLSKRSWQ